MILVKLCRYQPSVGDQYSERARQRRVLMNRETVLNQLRYEVSKLTAKMFRAHKIIARCGITWRRWW